MGRADKHPGQQGKGNQRLDQNMGSHPIGSEVTQGIGHKEHCRHRLDRNNARDQQGLPVAALSDLAYPVRHAPFRQVRRLPPGIIAPTTSRPERRVSNTTPARCRAIRT
ncbi:hypothetical protein GCM10023306_20200 [Novosphingobium ginsenosidimutans]